MSNKYKKIDNNNDNNLNDNNNDNNNNDNNYNNDIDVDIKEDNIDKSDYKVYKFKQSAPYKGTIVCICIIIILCVIIAKYYNLLW